MNKAKIVVGALALLAMLAAEVDAQRMGGGRRGGGGASRGGGRSSPSMSRSHGGSSRGGQRNSSRGGQQNVNRGGQQSSSRGGSNRGGQQSPNRGGSNRGGQQNLNRGGQPGANRGGNQSGRVQNPYASQNRGGANRGGANSGSANRGGGASRNQLDSFLGTSGGSRQRASNSNKSNQRSGSREGENLQVDWAGGRGSGTTDSGINYGGAGGAAKVTGPQGNSRVVARGGGAAGDGTNKVAGRGQVRGAQNADGTTAARGRGSAGATDGTNSAVARGGGGAVRTPGGGTAARGAGGARATDGTNTVGRAGSAGVIKGPGGNAYGRARGATTYNGVVTGAGQVNAVRGSWGGYGRYYTPGWYSRYPNAWRAAAITTAAWYAGSTWSNVCSYYPYEEPVSYDYGAEIYYEGDAVYSGETEIATAEEYYQQAADIADISDEKSADEDWLPLGIFAIVTQGQEKSDKTIQLAVNRDGIIRGNYSDGLTDDVKQVEGSVDKETQRVAITFVDNRDVVAEMGLYNLTEDVVSILVHHGADKTDQLGLIRIAEEDSE